MKAHSYAYKPEPVRAMATNTGLLCLIALIGAAGGVGALIALILNARTAVAEPSPVRTPDVLVFQVEPIDAQRAAEIRAEAFRAGLNEALASGCRPALSMPIAGLVSR